MWHLFSANQYQCLFRFSQTVQALSNKQYNVVSYQIGFSSVGLKIKTSFSIKGDLFGFESGSIPLIPLLLCGNVLEYHLSPHISSLRCPNMSLAEIGPFNENSLRSFLKLSTFRNNPQTSTHATSSHDVSSGRVATI